MDGERHDPPALPPVKRRSTHYREAGWAPGPVWTGAENLIPSGIRSSAVQSVASRYSDYTLLAHSTKTVQLFNSRISSAVVLILRVAVVYL